MIGAHAEDMDGFVLDGASERVGKIEAFERALGPVEEAVESGVRSVDIVAAVGDHALLEPFLALFGDAITIGIGELPQAGRSGGVDASLEPEAALDEADLVGKDGLLLILPVAIGIDELENAILGILPLFLGRLAGAARIGDIQGTLIVKAGTDGAWGELGVGQGGFDGESVGHREGVGTDLEFGTEDGGVGEGQGNQQGRQDGICCRERDGGGRGSDIPNTCVSHRDTGTLGERTEIAYTFVVIG